MSSDSVEITLRSSRGAEMNVLIVHSNGASLHAFVRAKCVGKTLIWGYQGYQLSCIDGLGRYVGLRAPMTPLASALTSRVPPVGAGRTRSVHAFDKSPTLMTPSGS